MTELASLLLAQLPKFQNKRIRLAEAIKVTPSRLTRVIKGEYALGVENCLRLALAAGLLPSDVLRAAKKGDLADLIERAYGHAAGKHPDLLSAISDDETAAAVQSFLRLPAGVRAWIAERSADVDRDLTSPRDDAPTPAATAAGRTRPARARRR